MPLSPPAPVRAPRAARRPAAPRARRGLTIVELLVAATITVLVCATLLTLLVSQGRTFQQTQGESALQRDVRLGLALLPMDLRAASRRDNDYLTLNASEIALNATIGNSMICGVTNLTANGATIVLPPEFMQEATLTTFFTQPRRGDLVKVLIRRGAGGLTDVWLTARISADPESPPTGAVANLCQPANSRFVTAAHAALPRTAISVDWTPTLDAADVARVIPGMPVRVLRGARYRLVDGTGGRAFLGERQPDGNWGPEDPIAGPYEATASPAGAGIRFSYFDTLGVALAPPIVPDRLGRIDVRLRGRTPVRTGGADSLVVRDSALVRVSLRNRL